MKKFAQLLVVAMLMFALVLTGCGSDKEAATEEKDAANTTGEAGKYDQYDEITLKLSMSGTERGVDYISGQHMADKVAEMTGGKVKIELYASNILAGGSQAEAINLMTQGGAMDMGLYSAAVLSNLDQSFLVVMLPFIFKDYADVNTYLDGTGDEWMTKKMAEYGLVNLGAMHCGIKQWTNNDEEKRTPEDFVNFKMRIPGGEVSNDIWKALGADPVSMSWSEVYTALQQGTVDGHENGYQTLFSNNIHEVQKYITEANYQYDGYWLMVNEKVWDSLKPATQELLEETGAEMVHFGRDYLEKEEINIKKQLIEKGNVITELTPEERQVFIDATAGVREKYLEVYGQETYDAWGIKL